MADKPSEQGGRLTYIHSLIILRGTWRINNLWKSRANLRKKGGPTCPRKSILQWGISWAQLRGKSRAQMFPGGTSYLTPQKFLVPSLA
jgi:hypothetical protein